MQGAKPKGSVRTIRCYHCGHTFGVSARAMSSSCPKCSKPLTVEDVVVKTAHFVRKLQTCGRIVVQAKGQLNAPVIEAQLGVEVLGILEGNVTSGGPVKIGPKAKWKGDCRAPSLNVESGARIGSGYFVVPDGPAVPEESAGGEAEPAAAEDGAPPAPKRARAQRARGQTRPEH